MQRDVLILLAIVAVIAGLLAVTAHRLPQPEIRLAPQDRARLDRLNDNLERMREDLNHNNTKLTRELRTFNDKLDNAARAAGVSLNDHDNGK